MCVCRLLPMTYAAVYPEEVVPEISIAVPLLLFFALIAILYQFRLEDKPVSD